MFDIGWSELVVIAVVALIAIGPKELPGVLRMVGQWMGKARKMAAEFQGQLPGAILEMDISNGKQTFTATNISDKADLALIKEPTGKKHYTPAEYKKEVNKMMDEMQQNMGGGNRQIRIN